MASTVTPDVEARAANHESDQRLAPAPLAGPGTSRANRRLQLRKNGFRGKAVQQRNVTPVNSVTPNKASGSWSPAINDLGSLAEGDGEMKVYDQRGQEARRRSSSILQEVNQSSLRHKGRGKAKGAMVSIFQDENTGGQTYDSNKEPAWQLESSPACLPPDAPNLTKSKKKQQQQQQQQQQHRPTVDMARDAALEEKDQYIEHLESQLAATQTQLSSVTSPTVTQARSLKMRALNAQIRALQDELAGWEAKYHDRIQEEFDERNQVEAGLKSRIRSVEKDMEAYAQNARDLQHQLEQTKKSLDAAESANMELEKRLETFANIVATSPQKPDFGFIPFERRGHVRRQSALPRFPTTGSLQPPQASWVMPPPPPPPPPSANNSHTQEEPCLQQESQPPLQTSTPSMSNVTTEVDFAYRENAVKRDSMLSTTSSRLSWTLPEATAIDGLGCPSTGKTRPSRRMRRFHAGSLMPKPLILSGTTQMDLIPATAPLLESYESPPAFPFPEVEEIVPRHGGFHDSPLVYGQRRRHTSAEILSQEDIQSFSPLAPISQRQTSASRLPPHEPVPRLASPTSALKEDTNTPRKYDYSSLTSAIGRNLFEELRRVRTVDTDITNSTNSGTMPGSSPPSLPHDTSSPFSGLPRNASHQSPSQLRQRRILHQRSMSEQTALPTRSRSKTAVVLPSLMSSSRSQSSRGSVPSTLPHQSGGAANDKSENKIVTVFSDLWRHPYILARRCFMRGERLMLFSSGVNKVQWWLLSFLLGPLVCKSLVQGVASPYLLTSSGPLSSREWRRKWRRDKNGVARTCTCGASEGGRAEQGSLARHSPWLWIKFSLTLAFAIGAAIKDGPASLLGNEWIEGGCTCVMSSSPVSEPITEVEVGTMHDSEAVESIEMKEPPVERPRIERVDTTRSLADELEDAEGEFDHDGHEDE